MSRVILHQVLKHHCVNLDDIYELNKFCDVIVNFLLGVMWSSQ